MLTDGEVAPTTVGHRGRLRSATKWFGRAYVGLGILFAIAAVVLVAFGDVGPAIRALGDALGFGLLGAAVVAASHLSADPLSSLAVRTPRALTKRAWEDASSAFRIVFAVVAAVELAAAALVAFLVIRTR